MLHVSLTAVIFCKMTNMDFCPTAQTKTFARTVQSETSVERTYLFQKTAGPSLYIQMPHMLIIIYRGSYLERVEAGDDSAIVHLTALGWVGKFAFFVTARARAPLELTTHLQSQPLGVTHSWQCHRHFADSHSEAH